MKKKIALTAAAVALVGTLAIGGTLAWFTDVETATNVVTTGKVDIILSEEGGDDGIITEDGLTYKDVMPGDVLKKTVTIQNVANDAYVRAKIVISGSPTVLSTLKDKNQDNDIIFGGLQDLEWLPSGKNEYTAEVSNGLMTKDSDVWTLFESITIPGDAWDNIYVNQEFTIKVIAEAIQSSNMKDEAEAWGKVSSSVDDIPDAKEDTVGTIDGVRETEAPADQN